MLPLLAESRRDFAEGCTVAGADLAGELLGILAVHPLREETVARLLRERENGRQVLDELLRGKISCHNRILRPPFSGEKK
jgi:hypothetical protein